MATAAVRGRGARLAGAAAVAALAVVAYVVLAAVPGWERAAAGVEALLALAGCGALLARVVLVRQERAAWALSTAGAVLLAAVYLGLLLLSEGSAVIRPDVLREHSALALGSMAGYALLVVAQMLLLRQRMRRPLVSAWLDVSLVALHNALVGAVLLVPWIQRTSGLDALSAHAVGLRPVEDVLLLGVALAHGALVGWRTDRRLAVLLAACAGLALTDVLRVLHVTGLWNSPLLLVGLNACHLVTLSLLALAAWQRPVELAEELPERRPSVLRPVVALLVAGAVLAVDRHHRLPDVAVHLALAVVAVVGLTVVVVVREVLLLADSRRQARTDDLTGLANRRALLEHLDRVTGDGGAAGLLLLDLDRFKDVNDRLGHRGGDELLHRVALRLREVGAPGRLLARLGGDEFAVVLPGAGADAARDVARELLTALREPFAVAGGSVRVGASVGVAAWPSPAGAGPVPAAAPAGGPHGRVDPASPRACELLREADAAMYAAKRAGGGVAVYDAAADRAAREELQLVEELRAGTAAGELLAFYQPQVDLRSGRVVGVEALVRWQHPRLGLLAPAAFLDLAEEHGLMAEVTAAVLEQAAAEAAGWHRAGRPLRVSVNLATSCLLAPALPALVDDVLRRSGLDAAALVLEITETTLMQDPERSRETVERLLELGVAVSIDDYGTGYSSLAYLQDLPAAELKLDRSFTARLTRDPRTAAIVASTAELARSLGLRLVVEGVEDAATVQRLAELDVDEVQGYHYSRPVPAAEVADWLERHEPRPAGRPGAAVAAP